MEIKSTTILDNLSFESIFQLQGKVQSVEIISAYTDVEFIDNILDYILKNGNKVGKPHFSIHVDYHASGYSSNQISRKNLDHIAEKIQKKFDSKSGIFLAKDGQLFHSKCIISQSRTSINLILGSINFTNYGFSKNEEMAICGQAKKEGHSQINKLVNQVWNYIKNISSEQIGYSDFNIKPSSVRQVLLDGEMYYEQKDNNPFNFPLNLPPEIRDIDQNINPLIGAKINNSLSLEMIISKTDKLNKLIVLKASSGLSWKKFCIETCYGFWAPSDERENIEAVIDDKLEKRSPYYKSLFKVIESYKDDIKICITNIARDIEEYVIAKNIKDKNGETIKWSSEDTLIAWDDWYERLVDKLKIPQFRKRIIVGIITASVPNVWSDKISASDFEESFAENLQYYFVKGQVSSNKHAAKSFLNKYPLNIKSYSTCAHTKDLVTMLNNAIETVTYRSIKIT